MRLVAVGCVRNEGDIATAWARHTLTLCDELVVLDDKSTDDTVAKLRAAGATVRPLERYDYHSQALTELIYSIGCVPGVDMFVPLDADEFPLFNRATLEAAVAIPDGTVPAMRVRTHGPLSAYLPSEFYPFTDEGEEFKCCVPGRNALEMVLPNHAASHRVAMRDGSWLPMQTIGDLAHVPVRSWPQYIAKVVAGVRMLLAEPELMPGEGAHMFKALAELRANGWRPNIIKAAQALTVPPCSLQPDCDKPLHLALDEFADLMPTLAEMALTAQKRGA